MKNIMTVHFFHMRMSHLAPTIIDNFLNNFVENQKIILCFYNDLLFGNYDTELHKYERIFIKNSFQNYKIVTSEKDFLEQLKKNISQNNICVLHGYFNLYNSLSKIKFLICNKSYLSKIIYVHWGLEFDQINSLKKILKKRIRDKIYRGFFRNIVLTDTDKDILSHNCKGLNNIEVLGYIPTKEWKFNLIEDLQSRDRVKIMVSHSGYTENMHIKSLELLHDKFNDCIEELSLPLCYGDEQHIRNVIQRGEELFGDRFTYFTKLLKKDEYIEYIKKYDIYINAAERQTGLGAAVIALINGLKVYCGANVEKHFSDIGCVIKAFDSLYDQDLKEFISPLSNEEREKNFNILSNKEMINTRILQWESLLFIDAIQ